MRVHTATMLGTSLSRRVWLGLALGLALAGPAHAGSRERPNPAAPAPHALEVTAEPETPGAPLGAPGAPLIVRETDAASSAAHARGSSRASDPLLREYPLLGVATSWGTQVFAAPSAQGPVSGYLRRGSGLRLRAGFRAEGCDSEWHAVFGGGYVCSGRGVSLGALPASAAPTRPVIYDALPYSYAKTTARDLALYAREPTPEEEQAVAQRLSQGANPLESALAPRARPSPVLQSAAKQPASPLAAAGLPQLVRRLLQPGFYVSLAEPLAADAAPGFVRTLRGDFVRLAGTARVNPSSWHGQLLPVPAPGPIALVARPDTRAWTRDLLTGQLTAAGPLRPLEALALDPEPIERSGRRYRAARDGRIVPEDALRFLPELERPQLVPKSAHWIAISLERQTLVAYEGSRAVYATLVSTGKAGFETPTGIFRIQSKHISATMDGEVGDEAYSIEDVPWVMYFAGSIALHAAFWHERFGQPRSHGCVNLAPLDARWLFDWASPQLPAGFHGVYANPERLGTFVVVAP